MPPPRAMKAEAMSKLILIMIDGISADHFERSRHRLPHLDSLAQAGTQVAAVAPEMCGTSCPGRTSIVTGVPPGEHGIYGNRIYTGRGFRWANPYDVKAVTLPALAVEQGLDVAGIGYGMVRPEDCSLYHGPWWVYEMLMRRDDEESLQADRQWLRAAGIRDPDRRLRELAAAGSSPPVVEPGAELRDELALGMLADHQLMDIAAGLACSHRAPDFILLEIAVTDYYLHKYGAEHPLTELSLRAADAQIGTLLARLEQAGVRDEYSFAVTSDHGHADIPTGFYVDRVLDGDVDWSSEGGVLMVKANTPRQAQALERKLVEHGVERWDNRHLPQELRESLLTFVMPEGAAMSFESSRPGTTGITGPSKYQSNHGMRPGTRSDYRFCIFSGPDIPQQVLPVAATMQIAPTLAKILDAECPWEAASLL